MDKNIFMLIVFLKEEVLLSYYFLMKIIVY
jgi:hypothetical protein